MKRNQNRFLDTRKMVIMAALIAIQIVLSRFLPIIDLQTLRVSFETVPLALAGLWLGPAGGALTALMADIVGTLLKPLGPWFPLIALGPMFFAAACGWGARRFSRNNLSEKGDYWKLISLTVTAGIINDILIGTLTLTLYRIIIMGNDGAFGALFVGELIARLTTKPFTIAACSVLISLIHRSVYRPVIGRIVQRTAQQF